jgi:hypothetical protein
LQAGRIVYDGPSDQLTPALLSSIYGAESSELFLRGFDQPAAALPESLPDSWRRHGVQGPILPRPAQVQNGSADRLSA